jgi:hypothetical protein
MCFLVFKPHNPLLTQRYKAKGKVLLEAWARDHPEGTIADACRDDNIRGMNLSIA